MGRYRTKVVEREAVQWTGDNIHDIIAFGAEFKKQAWRETGLRRYHLWVAANQAWLPVELYEWIIKDDHGFYPCKDDEFRKKYEPVDG